MIPMKKVIEPGFLSFLRKRESRCLTPTLSGLDACLHGGVIVTDFLHRFDISLKGEQQ